MVCPSIPSLTMLSSSSGVGSSSGGNAAVIDFFESRASSSSASSSSASLWRDCGRFYSKRLWHQLSNALQAVIAAEAAREDRKPGELLDIYEKAISDFEAKLNPFTMVCLCAALLPDCKDPDDALKFLEEIGNKVKKGAAVAASSAAVVATNASELKSQIHLEAFTYVRILQGKIYLSEKKDMAKAKVILH